MIIILFGPPGAGKGTQAQFLVNNFKFLQVSTGDLLRLEIDNNTEYGSQISNLKDKGKLVSDELMNNILDAYLSKLVENKNIIFDGYPRNLYQAKNFPKLLAKYNLTLNKVFFLNVDRELIRKRISGRVICSKCKKIFNKDIKDHEYNNHKCGEDFLVKRKDDSDETILKRYDLYIKDTSQLIDFYKSHKGFCEIDGNMEITQINEQIKGFLNV